MKSLTLMSLLLFSAVVWGEEIQDHKAARHQGIPKAQLLYECQQALAGEKLVDTANEVDSRGSFFFHDDTLPPLFYVAVKTAKNKYYFLKGDRTRIPKDKEMLFQKDGVRLVVSATAIRVAQPDETFARSATAEMEMGSERHVSLCNAAVDYFRRTMKTKIGGPLFGVSQNSQKAFKEVKEKGKSYLAVLNVCDEKLAGISEASVAAGMEIADYRDQIERTLKMDRLPNPMTVVDPSVSVDPSR